MQDRYCGKDTRPMGASIRITMERHHALDGLDGFQV